MVGRRCHKESPPVELSMDSFNPGSPAVQSHLEMLQGVIQRMAENSRSCKFWSITALSAVLFLGVCPTIRSWRRKPPRNNLLTAIGLCRGVIDIFTLY